MMRRRAESALWDEKRDNATVRAFFDGTKPLTAKGKFALARASLAQGDPSGAAQLARQAWREDTCSAAVEKAVMELFGEILTRADHKARMDRRFYDDDSDAGMRMAQLLGGTDLLIGKARKAVVDKASNTRALLDRVDVVVASPGVPPTAPLLAAADERGIPVVGEVELAWQLFGATPPGWARVQAVSTWVHQNITFGYEWARPGKTAWDALQEGRGVCRDFAHLGVAFCRALNVPARYCTGYLADIGVVAPLTPMDFSGWFEAYLGGRWYTVDPRNLVPRIGRVLIARGRDAADVAITTTFGPNELRDFQVWTEPVILPG